MHIDPLAAADPLLLTQEDSVNEEDAIGDEL